VEGFKNLIAAKRIVATEGGTLRYVRYLHDFAFQEIDNVWNDISGGSRVVLIRKSTSFKPQRRPSNDVC
jgi:hypothetical protein